MFINANKIIFHAKYTFSMFSSQTVLLYNITWRLCYNKCVLRFFYTEYIKNTENHKEYRVCVEFCFLLSKMTAEIVWIIHNVFKQKAINKTLSDFYD